MIATIQTLPTPHPAVVFRIMPDGGVLFSSASETYYGLNATGAFIWEHLAPVCGTLDDLCVALQERHPDVPADVLRCDIAAVLDDLAASGLVVRG